MIIRIIVLPESTELFFPTTTIIRATDFGGVIVLIYRQRYCQHRDSVVRRLEYGVETAVRDEQTRLRVSKQTCLRQPAHHPYVRAVHATSTRQIICTLVTPQTTSPLLLLLLLLLLFNTPKQQ